MSNEQKLVDICFELVSVCTHKNHIKEFENMTQDQKMEWVAKRLDGCGFPTKPMGCSWGVLTK